jgi:hypothetical protein
MRVQGRGDGVAKLPAEEQEACKKQWADVEASLKSVHEQPQEKQPEKR